MVVANTASQNLSILRGVGDGTFTTGPILAVGQPAVFVAVADFDDDDHFDIYTANGSGNSVSVFRGLGAGASSASPQAYATGANATYGVLVDADNNSGIDLAVATPGYNAITLLLSARLGIGTVAGSLDACVGSTVTLSVEASGFGPISSPSGGSTTTFRSPDGGNVSGAQTAHLTPVAGRRPRHGHLLGSGFGSLHDARRIHRLPLAHDPPAAPVIALESMPAPGIEGSASATPGAFDYFWTAVGGAITRVSTLPRPLSSPTFREPSRSRSPHTRRQPAQPSPLRRDVLWDYLDVPPSKYFP